MAITTELIGKLGGGGVESMNIDQSDIEPGATATVTTIPIPQGVPHTIVILVKTTAYSSNATGNRPTLTLGDSSTQLPRLSDNPAPYLTTTSSSPITLTVTRNTYSSDSYSAAFTGVIYWWPNK